MNRLFQNKHTLIFAFICSIFSSTIKVKAQGPGDLFFGAPMVHEIRLTFAQANYWDSLIDAYTNDYYIHGSVEIDGFLINDCGVKPKGNSSYNNPSTKKSFKIDFNEFVQGQKFNNLKKINLNNGFKDPSFLREKLMLDFLGHIGVPSPRCTYAEVYINNVRWGLYTVVEQVDKVFLKQRFGDDKGNNFKGDPTGDLKWLGSNVVSYYPKYELSTNETQNIWTDLVQLIDKINNTPSSTLPDTLRNYFHLDEYYKTWAAHILFSNLDSYLGSGHNYYLYHDSITNKFRFISWDVNEAFGNFSMGMNMNQMENLSIFFTPNPAGNRPLHERLLQNNAVKQDLATVLCQMVNYDFSIWNLEDKIDSLVTILRPYVYADNLKFYSNQNFEDNIIQNLSLGGGPGGGNIPGIKSFLINRRNSVVSQLAAWSCISGQDDIETIQLSAWPNPVNGNFIHITGPELGGCWYEIYTSTGRLIQSGTVFSPGKISCDGWDSNGIYLLRLKIPEQNSVYVTKILKL